MTTPEFLARLRILGVKLWVEEERLRYSAPTGALTADLLKQLSERKAEVVHFLKEVGRAARAAPQAIRHVPRDRPLPLSFAQERLWIFDRLNPQSYVYNVPGAARLKGRLDLNALGRSFDEIVRRHETLRTAFTLRGVQPIQNISAPFPLSIPVVDLGSLPEAEREAEARRLTREEACRPFDLSAAPLLRVKVLKLGEDDHVLLLTMHHVIADGWSIGVLVREFAKLYRAFVENGPSPLPPLPVQYADFAVWQRGWLQGEVLENQLSFWKKQLAGSLPVLEIPTDRPRPVAQTFNGTKRARLIPQPLSEELKELSRREGATLFMTLLAAFKTLLHRYTGQDDLLVGTPIASRNRAEVEGLIGYFANTLVLRTDLSGEPSFLESLRRVREVALGAYAHQDIPFEKLIEELQPPRDISRSPLFQVAFVLQNTPTQKLSLPGLSLDVTPVENGTAKFDLTLEVTEVEQGLEAVLEYNSDLFDGSTAERMLGHYHVLLESIVASPAQPVSKLPMLTERERNTILSEFSRPGSPLGAGACLHEMFEARAAAAPAVVAVSCGGDSLSYGELNGRANRLARRLRSLGVGAESLVGVYMGRGVELVVALLGVLKAGGAYVPLDPAYPTQRLAFMLEDADVNVVLTQQDLVGNLPRCRARVLCLDTEWESIAEESEQNLPPEATPQNLAYVIYTSGSTGRPKGTAVSHANVVRLFEATRGWYDFGPKDVWALFHSYAFDFSVWEMWGALIYGGRLVVVPYSVSRSPEAFRALLAEERVTVLNQTPSAFRLLAYQEEAQATAPELSLRLIIFGGEALEVGSLRPWFGRYGDECPRLVNMYGITETTVHVTYRPLSFKDVNGPSRSYIGSPIPDLELYLLDRHMQPVPVGIPGEIHVGGAGLSRGYLRRPELTAQRFVPHPFGARPGERLYKSGDLGRFLPDGDIEYLGRIDSQVKIRGFRVELGEIESVITQHEAVREASVITRDAGGEKLLAAYIVPRHNSSINVIELRGFLRERLPEYMVPANFVTLESLPLTPNGKVDRKALPEPESSRPQSGETYVAPRTTTEQALAEIWEEVLGLERVGVHDNFFDLGGDSIRSIQVHAKAHQRGLSFSVQQLFRHSTIAEIAREVTADATAGGGEASSRGPRTDPFALLSGDERSRLPADVEDAYPLSSLQAGMIFHSQRSPDSGVYHNVTSLHVKCPFDRQKLQAALAQLAARHPALRTSFDLVSYGEPLQLVHRQITVPLKVHDLRGLSPSEQGSAIDEWFEAAKSQGFDLTRAPLMRFYVHLRSTETFQLSWAEHHVILDGWSVASMMTELFKIYLSSFGETPPVLEPPLASTFRDFVALEKQVLTSEQQRGFWLDKLSGGTATLLPRRPSSSRAVESRQRSLRIRIPADVSEGLKELSRRAGVPLKTVLLSAHLYVLSLLSGQRAVVTGVVLNGRLEEADGDRTLGLFLNTLPLRSDMRGGSWLDLVRETFEAEREMSPFRRFPLAELQRLEGGPLFEATFNFINFHVYKNLRGLKDIEFLDVKVFADTNYTLRATFSLDLFTSDVQLELGYLVSELTEEQVRAASDYYLRTLSAMAEDPASSYESFSALSPAERQRLLIEWNDTSANIAPDACVHQLFEAQVERTPEALAVRFEEHAVTYRELNRRANRLAHRLRALGVGPDVLVGLYTERSLEAVVGVFAILKAGAAYVPLDPQHPQERLAYMLEEARVPFILAQRRLVKDLPRNNSRVICLDDAQEAAGESELNLVGAASARNLCYLIYTSGSTGRPKGILVEHRSLVNYVAAISRRMLLEDGLHFAMAQPLTVDACLTALYPPLVTGGCVHVISQERATDPHLLRDYFSQHHMDCLKIAPSHFAALLNWVEPAQLMPQRWLIIGGEAPRREWVEGLHAAAPGCRILNQYGPTEATVATLTYCFDALRDDEDSSAFPAGKPLPNTQAFILDEHMRPVPVGTTGELYLGGDCLARGYLRHPDLTAEKFIPHPYSKAPGARLYKTGDMARHLPDGNIVFAGRADEQVKIRGYRVEPAEVAVALSRHPAVLEAAVLGREDAQGEKRLVAYVVPVREGAPSVGELQSFLKESLPEYMVPTVFVMLDKMPRTSHGKLELRALPEAEAGVAERRESFTPPRDLLELRLAQVWEGVLKVKPVGVRDNFFELGGHSIVAVHLMARIQNEFKRSIPLAAILQHPTVEQMAALLRERKVDAAAASPLVVIQSAGSKKPFFGVHPVGGNVLSYFALARHLGTDQPFYGLQAVSLDGEAEPLTRVEDMAARYIEAIREIQPRGPYLLGGWSMGGVVSFEMAQQLRERGEETSLVVLIDSRLPHDNEEGGEHGDEEDGLLVRFFLDLFGLSGKEPPVSFDNLRRLEREDLLGYLLESAVEQGILPRHTDASQLKYLFRVFEANRRALLTYRPAGYPGRVVIFRAGDGTDAASDRVVEAWREVAPQLEVQTLLSDHYRIVADPHVQELAERMKPYLEEAHAGVQNLRRENFIRALS